MTDLTGFRLLYQEYKTHIFDQELRVCVCSDNGPFARQSYQANRPGSCNSETRGLLLLLMQPQNILICTYVCVYVNASVGVTNIQYIRICLSVCNYLLLCNFLFSKRKENFLFLIGFVCPDTVVVLVLFVAGCNFPTIMTCIVCTQHGIIKCLCIAYMVKFVHTPTLQFILTGCPRPSERRVL